MHSRTHSLYNINPNVLLKFTNIAMQCNPYKPSLNITGYIILTVQLY